MSAMLVRASSRRKGHNYITLMNAWFEGPARKRLTLAARDIFQCLLHVTNAKYFPDSIDVYEADLAGFTDVDTRTVKRSLADHIPQERGADPHQLRRARVAWLSASGRVRGGQVGLRPS